MNTRDVHGASAPRVVIVGGGLAGLAAAVALAETPLRVELCEARRQTGGRAGSFLDPGSGQVVDYCQHVAMGCCENFLQLMRRVGLDAQFARSREITFFAEGVPASRMVPSTWLPPPLHFAPAFSRLRFLTGDERRQVRRGLWRLMRMDLTRDPAAVRTQTMGQWLRQEGQSEGAIVRFWNLVLASALGESVDGVAVVPARKVFVDGFLRRREAADLLVPRQPLAELFGRLLPQWLAARGIAIHRGTRVRQCEATDGGRFKLHADGPAPLMADDVVAAVPWHALPRLLSRSPLARAVPDLDAIGRIPAAPISGVHLWLDRPVVSLPHAVIVGRMSQWVFRPAGDAAQPEGHYHQVVVSAAHDLRGRRREEIEAEVVGDLQAAFPSAGAIRCLRSRVVTDPAAVFSISPQTESLRPTTETAQPGLYLAGDWVQTGWPATMEGAVLSGFLAANAIRRRHALPPAPVPSAPPPGWLAQWLIAL